LLYFLSSEREIAMESTNGRETPAPGIIEEVLARSRPDLERLFQRHWVTAEEAEDLLGEAMTSLLLRWGRLGDPALWLVRTVDAAIQRRLLIPLFQ
jgi:hypothetical protein